ncbi:helix-turn-helix transcriptional regulator [Polycladidibacter hongkongensis]|uniref:helix-turn-helix transcriptional regulator n=1 Tax=Polycladidibacter hongkongensis TaxID=1647556 RepID=UPI0008325E55|nr:metalloregulator ArsR/SmtB family transcription factor [Pseudovibrio hongkongensis]
MNERTKQRLLTYLKKHGSQTAATLAKELGITSVAARQHLDSLLELGSVTFEDIKGNVGRPRRVWSLSGAGHRAFPDRHDHLLSEVLKGMRELYGEEGVEQLVRLREASAAQAYAQELTGLKSFRERLQRLAELRTAEGYMADVVEVEDGTLMLIENHCSICRAAQTSQAFCQSELRLFQALFANEAEVQRQEHIIAGDRRCAYKLVPKPAP